MKKSGVDFSDLQKVSDNIDNLTSDVEDNGIDIQVAFNKKFMQKHTSFSTIEDFLRAGNFSLDLDNISLFDLDTYVSKSTTFSDWQEMIDTALFESIKDISNT